MKLRRIDILGFKSFRTKTGLEIADGVTSIVGPNGCGKSNVVDAIRWSIGSQSPKDLRGRAMEDVIFAGSENHKPMGFAEVSLTLANDGRDIPLEWKEHAEIKVTRRLFRTGESEYEINGSKVRLRDIHALFLGTGVGAKEAYSIIEQGRIGFIVAARPEERRVIIEEAAGITRYKFQRQSAQRRLEKTKENLVRVHDVLGEVERQLGSLQRQARKAARWRELTDSKRELEIRAALDRRDRAAAGLTAAEATLAQAAEAAERTRVTLVSADTRAAQLRSEVQLNEHALNQATEATFKARARRDLLKSGIAHQEREMETVRERSVRIRQRQGEHAELDAQSTRDLERVRGAIVTAETEQSSVSESLEKRAAELASARGAESETMREVDRLSATAARSRALVAELEARMQSAVADQSMLATRLADADAEIARMTVALTEQVNALAAAREARTAAELATRAADERLEQARAAERAAGAAADAARAAHRQASAGAEAARAKTRALDGVLTRGDGYAAGVRAALRAVERGELTGIGRPVAERLRVPPEFRARLTAVAGPFLDALVADGEAAARRFVSWARGQGVAASVTWGEPVSGALADWCSAVDPVPHVVAARFAQTGVGDDVFAAGAHRVSGDGRAMRTGEGLVSVGTGEAAGSAVVQLAAELEEARLAESEALAAVPATEAAVAEASDVLDRALATRTEAAEAAQAARVRARETKSEVEERERAAGRLEREAAAATQARERVASRTAALSAGVEADQAKLEGAVAERRESESALAEFHAMLPDLRERVRAESDAVAELKATAARAAERASGLRATRERLEQTLAASVRQVASLNAEAEEVAAAIAKLDASLAADRRALVSTEEDTLAQEERLNTARGRHDATSTRLLEVEASMHAARKAHGANADKLRAAELAAERARNDVEHADAALAERFLITLAAARAMCAGRPFDTAAREELADVTSKLDRLGVVNPAAEEEYSEANERFEYLAAQKLDLETAIEDLESAIRKMDKTSKDLFISTFNEVNSRFQVLFPRLFEGGTARMELTMPDDLLNTGVDIIVSPPGKRLQSMTLLSGGEKALTAVALIFSIFQLKPTPFCILDEVDAPLDAANVARFAEMVREMSATSQFLLITHNKRSMEAAGTLYGVTMQEPGVSNVVGVRMPGRGDSPESSAV